MAKVTDKWYSSGQGYKLDCGHEGFNMSSTPDYKVGDKIPCDICADNEKQVKAARAAGMEAVKEALHGHYLPLVSNDMIIDNLIKAAQ